MLCNFCKGFKNVVNFQPPSGKPSWMKCPFCEGFGTILSPGVERQPEEIRIHAFKSSNVGEHIFSLTKLKEEGIIFVSQLLVKLGMFKSMNDARKNGFHKDITIGEHWFKKKTMKVIIQE